MNRSDALRILAQEQRVVPTGAAYTVGPFEPADAPGVTRLFYAVYGDGYHIDTFYIPEKLVEENQCGNIHSVVARTASCDVVCHSAFYRSSSPNLNLYEFGLGLTLPAYRGTMAFFRASKLSIELAQKNGVDAFFGEAVCNHIITQKLSVMTKGLETALEPALMPARAYEAEQSADGRVGCLLYFRVDRDCHRKLHIPAAYRNELAFLLNGLNLDRELIDAGTTVTGGHADIEIKRFEFAGIARCTITTPGADLPARLAKLEGALLADN